MLPLVEVETGEEEVLQNPSLVGRTFSSRPLLLASVNRDRTPGPW